MVVRHGRGLAMEEKRWDSLGFFECFKNGASCLYSIIVLVLILEWVANGVSL